MYVGLERCHPFAIEYMRKGGRIYYVKRTPKKREREW